MMNARSTFILASLAIGLLPGAAAAQAPLIDGWSPGTAFTVDPALSEAPNAGSRFGFAVSMTDDIAVIGAPDVRLVDLRFPALNLGSNGAGAAFVFVRTAGTNDWTFVQRLIAPTRVLAQTGTAVAIDPVTKDIVVGAWAYDAVATFGGAAFVYRKGDGDSWGDAADSAAFGSNSRIPSQTLAPEDLQAIDQFGFSVAIHDGTAVVGCPLAGDNNSGAVYVFERQDDDTYLQTQKFTDPEAGANDQMGTKVAIHDGLVVLGIQNDDVEGRVNAGSVAVLAKSGGSWTEVVRLAAPSPATSAALGSSVAVVDGTTNDWVIAGAPLQASGSADGVSGNGVALVFKSPNSSSFTLDATLVPRTANINNNFGYSASASLQDPPLLMVGCPGYDTAIPSADDPSTLVQVNNAGAGFSFARVGAAWERRGETSTRGDAWSASVIANSNIGRSAAIPPAGGAFAIVGADTPTGSRGTVVPFRFTNAIIGTDPGQVSGPASGILDADGLPGEDGSAGTGAGGTGGTIGGGGSPSTGITAGPGAITIPLTPIVYDWGIVKGTAVALEGRSVHLLQTDGKHRAQRPRFGYLGELPAGSSFVGLADMNGDFSGDVVFVDRGKLKYWKRDAFRILDTLTVDTLPAGFLPVAIADIDNDRKPDVVLQGAIDPTLLRVWHIDGGAISGSDEYDLPAGDWNLFTGNFRTRTQTDLMARNAATGAVFLVGLGDDDEATLTAVASRPNSVRLAGFGDVNGDGQPDVFWQGSEIEVDLVDQDDAGNYVRTSRRRTGLAQATIVNIRDWNDDGKVDFWMRRGSRNYVQYGTFVNGYVYGNSSRDLGKVPGTVVGVADR